MKSLKILIFKALLITLVAMMNRSSLTMEWVRYVAVDSRRSREEPATFEHKLEFADRESN